MGLSNFTVQFQLQYNALWLNFVFALQSVGVRESHEPKHLECYTLIIPLLTIWYKLVYVKETCIIAE